MPLQSECKTESLKLRLLSLRNLSNSDVTTMSVCYKLKQKLDANTSLYSTFILNTIPKAKILK